MARLWQSAKFWTVVLDCVVASLTIVLAWFLAPEKVSEALALVAIWQPAVLLLINGITREDVASKEAGFPVMPPPDL